MDYFNLPSTTIVQRVVPKNTFDSFTTRKQKELFTKDVAKIMWKNSISTQTTNLPCKDILEIQIFSIELKQQKEIKTLLDIIDKSIVYHIIFVVEFENLFYLSTSAKHPSPLNETKSVIDWTFKTQWSKKSSNLYKIELRKSIENVYYEFCKQLSLKPTDEVNCLIDLIDYDSQIQTLIKEIDHLQKKIATCQQFNKKVEYNLKLKELQQKLSNI